MGWWCHKKGDREIERFFFPPQNSSGTTTKAQLLTKNSNLCCVDANNDDDFGIGDDDDGCQTLASLNSGENKWERPNVDLLHVITITVCALGFWGDF